MSRRLPELTLKPLSILLLVLLLGPGAPLRAQERGPDVPTASLESGLRFTRMRSRGVRMPGGLAQLRVAPGIWVGGGGWWMKDAVRFRRTPGQERALRAGYGGAVVSFPLPLTTTGAAATGRALVGAGNADVSDPASGALLESDNFAVLEPELDVEVSLIARLHLLAGASWRFAFGVEDLTGVDRTDLSGPALVLALRIGPL